MSLNPTLTQLVREEVAFQYDVAKSAIGTGTAVSRPTIKDTKKLISSVPMVLNGSADHG